MKDFTTKVMTTVIGLAAVFIPTGHPLCWAVTAGPLEDWYNPGIPFFASDVILDPAQKNMFVSDQITGEIFQVSMNDSGSTVVDGFGVSLGREEILTLMSSKKEFSKLLEGEINLEWDADRIIFFDGRQAFGCHRWMEIDVNGEKPMAELGTKPSNPSITRQRDQSLLAEAVLVLAGQGKRVRPWRWSMRNDVFQLVDQRGRAYVFSAGKAFFGQARLRLIGEIDSLFSRLTDYVEAELQMESTQTLQMAVGQKRWTARVEYDPYTDVRVMTTAPDTTLAARSYKSVQPNKYQPALPQQWNNFLQQTKILAEGPAGQLISCKIRLAHLGIKPLLILTRGGRVRIFPWTEEDLEARDIVIFPEGFGIASPPGWSLIGWSPDFSGVLVLGNSRFQRIVPILSMDQPLTSDTGGEMKTAGIFVLDAEQSSISEWPRPEWPLRSTDVEFQMSAEPLDITVSNPAEVFVLAHDVERGHRIFLLTEILEPVLDLPESVLPAFLPGRAPILISKTQTKQTLWTMAGQPPALIRKGSFDVEWQLGQGISWRYEPDGLILFSTDPSGESDTAVTVQIEGISRVRQAVQQEAGIWLLETDSGIIRLDAQDPTAPDIEVVEEEGIGLRMTPEGAIYTFPVSGTSEVMLVPPGGKKQSLGRFKHGWMAMGFDRDRLFFKDRSTGKFYIVRLNTSWEAEDIGQVTGRLEFKYDDPTDVLFCAMGPEAFCMLVRPKAPTFLLGPMPLGSYRLDISAGPYDLSGDMALSVTQPELILDNVLLTKTLDFIYQRALMFEEGGNYELAKFNYDLYLSLYPKGRAHDMACAGLVRVYAANQRWEEMAEFYRKFPKDTAWPSDALELLFDHMPRLSERMEIASKWLSLSHPPSRMASLLYFLYRHSLDPAYRISLQGAGLPAVYSKFFDHLDAIRKTE